jgi:Anti-sigma-K factor rskA
VTLPTDKDLFEAQLAQLAFGELDPQAAAELRAAIAADPVLAREAQRSQRVLELLAAAQYAPPPPALRAKVMAAAKAELEKRAVSSPKSVKRTAWPLAVAASVAVFATGLSAFLWVQQQRLARDFQLQAAAASMLREPNIVTSFELGGTAQARSARGFVLLDLDAKRASIAVRDLPPLPAGQQYALWAELADGSVPCGDFRPQADGSLVTQFPIPVDSYTSPIRRLKLTIEAAPGARAPTGALVMTST